MERRSSRFFLRAPPGRSGRNDARAVGHTLAGGREKGDRMSAAGLASRVGVCAAMLLANGCRAKESSQAAARDGGWAGLSFVEDDYEGALARARKEHRLLFVDAWAPWCHSCISMKAFVFNDPVLAPLASKFVWASVDTEKPKSESFVRKYPMKNWPTLRVVHRGTENPRLQCVG